MKRLPVCLLCCLLLQGLAAQIKRSIYILNEKPTDAFALSLIPAEAIKSIHLSKDKDTLLKYEKGSAKNDVVIITLKTDVPLISYSQLLEDFHIALQDTALPAFVDGYALRYKDNFWVSEKTIENIAIENVAGKKILHIYPAVPKMLSGMMCLINGLPAEENSITFINPDAVKSIASLHFDEMREIYGISMMSRGVIYLKENIQLQPLSYFYNEFHIPAEMQQWPMFFAGTDRQITRKNRFVAMPSMVKNMRVNMDEMRLEIEATPLSPGIKTVAQKIDKVSGSRGQDGSIMICTISRKMLLQQYVKR